MSHPKTDPAAADRPAPQRTRPVPRGPGAAKISPAHLTLLAIVYVRQSSLQQVFNHAESRDRQYELAGWGTALGWPAERVVIIDDQGHSGQSAAARAGFQRLSAEVSMGHVGLVLGLEMSRLARSCADFQRLVELCALAGTLIADQEGVYDPRDANDRLLLGLKGTMSEFELVTMRNRLWQGNLHKARRAALFHGAPIGYVKVGHDRLELDPDAEARAVVALVFAKFEELGGAAALLRYLLEQGIRLGVRPCGGPDRDRLLWQRPNASTLSRMLHNPVYAGAYAYGRSSTTAAGSGKRQTRQVSPEQWHVLVQDCLPAYISWQQYQANQQRLRCNRAMPGSPGAARQGMALLPGLIYCGACGHAMQVDYPKKSKAWYRCRWHNRRGEPSDCPGLRASAVDEVVAAAVLRALEPSALELHQQALADVQTERSRLEEHWQQRLERARYEAGRAERQYQATEPENRLVARSLEARWEEALRRVRQLEEDYQRYRHMQPPQLTAGERELIAGLSHDVPALWQASSTTASDRKEVVRALVERVEVSVRADSDVVGVTIHWQGGMSSVHAGRRPVKRIGQMEDRDKVLGRLRQLREQGARAEEIAA